jgi:outer membrane protein assembly factor BamB
MPIPFDLWNQFGGNPAGSGFRLVNSAGLTSAWHTVLPGPVGISSPVLGPDGTVYIGTTGGQLVAIGARGVVKWTVTIAPPPCAVSTPAVAADGAIYCLCINNIGAGSAIVRDHRTHPTPFLPPAPPPAHFIVSVNPDGTIRWTVPIRVQGSELGWDTGHIGGAPRIVSQALGGKARVIFVIRYTVPIRYPEVNGTGPEFLAYLAIVDEHGTFRLFNRYEEEKLFIDAHGSGGFGSATLGDPPLPNIPRLPDSIKACEDTPVVFGSFPATSPWTILASGSEGLYAIHWSEEEGAITGAPRLVPGASAFPAPVAFSNGLLVAMSNGHATYLDSDTLTPYLPNPVSLDSSATVAGGFRQMYFFIRRTGTLLALDTNGTVWKSAELHADSVAYPAVTANRVYVSTMTRVWSFDLDLTLAGIADYPTGPPGGVSSPAVGPDGGVYYVNQFQGGTLLYASFPEGVIAAQRLHGLSGTVGTATFHPTTG